MRISALAASKASKVSSVKPELADPLHGLHHGLVPEAREEGRGRSRRPPCAGPAARPPSGCPPARTPARSGAAPTPRGPSGPAPPARPARAASTTSSVTPVVARRAAPRPRRRAGRGGGRSPPSWPALSRAALTSRASGPPASTVAAPSPPRSRPPPRPRWMRAGVTAAAPCSAASSSQIRRVIGRMNGGHRRRGAPRASGVHGTACGGTWYAPARGEAHHLALVARHELRRDHP